MRHAWVALCVLLVTFVAFASGGRWFGPGDGVRVQLGGVSAPVPTAIFVGIWTSILVSLLFWARSSDQGTGLRMPWQAWLAYLLSCCLSWFSQQLPEPPTAQAGAYLAAWALLPWLAHTIGQRVPLDRRGQDLWVYALSGLSLIALVSGRGLSIVPANINLTAMILVPGFVVATHECCARDRWSRALPALIILASLAIELRRTALITCGLATVLIIASSGTRRKLLSTLLACSLLLSGAVVLSYFFYAQSVHITDYLQSLTNVYDRGVAGGDLRRSVLTHQALETFRASPVLGIGFGSYLGHLQQLGVDQFYLARPHNLLLITLAETGIVGSVCLAFMLGLPAYHAWRCSDPSSRGRGWAIAYVSVGVYLLGNDYVHSPGFWPIYAAMIATSFPE